MQLCSLQQGVACSCQDCADLAALDAFEALQRLPLAGAIAGGTSPRSLFSVASNALLPYFTTREACVLRSVCQELRSTVADFPWQDAVTPILGSLAGWRSCFPRARAAKLVQRLLLSDTAWAHLAGDGCMTHLEVACCVGVTDERLALFGRLQRLDARLCPEITRRGLAALPLLEWADLRGCPLEEEGQVEEGGEEEEKEEEEEEEEEGVESEESKDKAEKVEKGEGMGSGKAEKEEEKEDVESEEIEQEEQEEEEAECESECRQAHDEDIVLDGRFILGPVDSCAYCLAPCLFGCAACCRETTCDFNGVTCRTGQRDGRVPVCCEGCIARRGCCKCQALECPLCTDQQDEYLAWGSGDMWCVGRSIARCAMCRRNVCGSSFAECGGKCLECSRHLCRDCGELQATLCDPCSDRLADNYDPFNEPPDVTVCGRCRKDSRVLCVEGGQGCIDEKRHKEAWERYQLSVSRKREWGH